MSNSAALRILMLGQQQETAANPARASKAVPELSGLAAVGV